MDRSTLLHLRIPFSFFLLPVYLFALSQLADLPGVLNPWQAILVFFILHFLLYPASNAYNSYFDKDEESIGGLEHPPPVSRQLYLVAIALDAVAVLLGLFISLPFAFGLLVYGLVSKAYSHTGIRLKKYPFLSWLIAGLFQGAFVYLLVCLSVGNVPDAALFSPQFLFPAFLSSALLWGAYPITQVYQHREDARRGDLTLSRVLGVRGTFIFTGLAFSFAIVGFFAYNMLYRHIWEAILLTIFLGPALLYFGFWAIKVWSNIAAADYRHTMRMNFLSSLCLNLYFLFLLLV